jgi:hypothetical protein
MFINHLHFTALPFLKSVFGGMSGLVWRFPFVLSKKLLFICNSLIKSKDENNIAMMLIYDIQDNITYIN